MDFVRAGYSDSDEALLSGLSDGNDGALSFIYKKHYPLIQNFIVRNSGDEQDARDIFQEAVIVLFEKAKSGDFELQCRISTFLYSVSRKLWLKRLNDRKRWDINVSDVHELHDDISFDETEEEKYRVMNHAMELLGEPCKSLLSDFYKGKLSMLEIAGKYGYTNPENAKNQKYKCLMRLKKIFFTDYHEIGK